jgi:hypothetical protein
VNQFSRPMANPLIRVDGVVRTEGKLLHLGPACGGLPNFSPYSGGICGLLYNPCFPTKPREAS